MIKKKGNFMKEESKEKETLQENLFESPQQFIDSLSPEQLKEFNSAISKRLTDEEIEELQQDIPYEVISNFYDDRVNAASELTLYKVFSYQTSTSRRLTGKSVIELFSSPIAKTDVDEKTKFKNKGFGASGEIFNRNGERYKFTFILAETRPFKQGDKKVKF
jgi:hypothetical protein